MWKTLSFCILGLVMVACIVNNFLAFCYKEAYLPWDLDLYAFLAVSNVAFFILHQLLSVALHPTSVTLATSPVPIGVVPASWRGRLGRQLMLWFEFLTNKLGVFLLCLHLGFLLHLFVLSPTEGRQEMTLLDPRLGRPLPEKDYGEGCDDINQVYDSLYDFFVFVHFTGFMLMAGCMRNFAVPFAIGVFDELLELSLQHIFPNFRECWWDHFIADIFGANLLGCLTGYLITYATEIQPLTWLSPKPLNEPTSESRLSLFPRPLASKVYNLFLGRDKRSLRFLAILFIHRIACFVVPFAFKYVMWVPVPHLIFIWYGVGQFGLQLRFYAELYQHLAASHAEEATTHIRNSDLGIWRYQWRIITFFIMALETGFIIKTLLVAYTNLTPPTYIIAIWILLAVALSFCLVFSFDRKARGAEKATPHKRKVP